MSSNQSIYICPIKRCSNRMANRITLCSNVPVMVLGMFFPEVSVESLCIWDTSNKFMNELSMMDQFMSGNFSKSTKETNDDYIQYVLWVCFRFEIKEPMFGLIFCAE